MSTLVGKKVLVTFVNWPVSNATYIYEGYDETGHYVRRSDGVQRHFLYENVQGVELVDEEEIPEGNY